MDVFHLMRLVEQNLRTNRRSSIETFFPQIKPMLRHFNGTKVREIDFLRVEEYKAARLAENAAPATINHEIGYLIRGLRLARRAGLVERIPEIDKLPISNARTGFVSEDQMERIAAELRPCLGQFVRFAYHTGWRRSEISRLEWSEVDFEDHWIDLKAANAKNRKGRRFPIHGKVEEIIGQQAEAVCGSFVFHRPGRETPIKKFCDQFRLAATKAGLGHIVLHDMRRSFVRNAIRAGVGVKTAMELSGHKTLSVFLRYNIINEADLIDAVTKMSRSRS